jgi:hypothetical protein
MTRFQHVADLVAVSAKISASHKTIMIQFVRGISLIYCRYHLIHCLLWIFMVSALYQKVRFADDALYVGRHGFFWAGANEFGLMLRQLDFKDSLTRYHNLYRRDG